MQTKDTRKVRFTLGAVMEKLRKPKFFNCINKFWFGAWVEILVRA